MSIIRDIACHCFSIETVDRFVVRKNKLKNRFKCLFAGLRYRLCNWRTIKTLNYYDIPIIINNFNRLGYLKKLINSLESRGYSNIYIIDNHSTNPPLLEYYNDCPYTVFCLNKNVGFRAIWETGIYEMFKQNYYVYTDSDMEIDDSCPNDFMEYFVRILEKYPTAQKVGFGIRIDDLPDSYPNKDKVIKWEKQFWNNGVESGLYLAPIDTTFALYRPYCAGSADWNQKVIRTGTPYLIKHLPWYNLDEFKSEEIYYLSSLKTSTHWSAVNKESLLLMKVENQI